MHLGSGGLIATYYAWTADGAMATKQEVTGLTTARTELETAVALRELCIGTDWSGALVFTVASLLVIILAGAGRGLLCAAACVVVVTAPTALLLTALANLWIIRCLREHPRIFLVAYHEEFRKSRRAALVNPGLGVCMTTLSVIVSLLVLSPSWRALLEATPAPPLTGLVCIFLSLAGASVVDSLVWRAIGRSPLLRETGHPDVASLMRAQGYRRGVLGLWKRDTGVVKR